MVKKLFLLTLFILPVLLVNGQRFNFGNVHSLPVAEAYYAMQDSKGYMWFATNKGIVRYEGNSAKIYNCDKGLPDNIVFKLCEDKEGRILFYSAIGKTGYIYKDSVYITGFSKYLEDKLVHGRTSVFDMYLDEEGFLWITSNMGTYKTNHPNDYSEMMPVTSNNDSARENITIVDDKKALSSINVTQIKSLKNSLAFSICINNKTVQKFYRYTTDQSQGAPSYGCALLLKNGTILSAIHSTLVIITPDGNMSKMKFGERILSLYQDREDGIWIGFRNSGVAYYPKSILSDAPVWSLVGQSVSNIFMDREGGIWATTLEKGIFYASNNQVIDYSNNKALDRTILSLKVIGQKILANDFSNHLSMIKEGKVSGFDFSKETKVEGLYDYLVNNGTVYIATSVSLMKSDTMLKNWEQINLKNTNQSTVCVSLVLAPNGDIYTLSHGGLYSIHNNNFELLGFVPSRSQCMCITKKGEIFIGCTNGLYQYKDSNFIYLGDNTSLLSSRINAITEDNEGALWILTSGLGIGIMKGGKIISVITEKNGLASNNCHDIAFGDENTAWIGTDNGISKIVNGKVIANYNASHGLISSQVLKLALQNNYLWLGTGAGLCMIDITYNYNDTVVPPVYISSVSVNDKPVASVSNLSYNSNNLNFTLDGPTFKGDKVNFIYRMVGIDSTWHNANLNEVSFNSLPPGSYSFEAKAINADGISSLKPAVLLFTIEKPFWIKWWFILSEIMLGSGLIYLFIRIRLISIQRREEEKTRMNKLIAEHEITALRTQMNPHFIFNVINSIQNYVLKNDGTKAYTYLADFSHLIRMMLNHAQDKELTLQKELEMLKLYIELEQLRFDGSFRFALNIDKDIEAEQIMIPAMLLQPYVENAIWHGLMNLKDKTEATLSLTISTGNEKLSIVIEDSGVGREATKRPNKDSAHKSIGMNLTQKRMELLNKLQGEGKVIIEVTDLLDAQQKPKGTRVKVDITQNDA